MGMTFEQIDKIVINAIECSEEHSVIYSKIGEWYYKLLNSNKSNLKLFIPLFSNELVEGSLNYIYFFDLTFKLLNKEPLIKFDGTFLFDIFEYNNSSSRQRKENSFILRYQKSDYDINFFEGGTVVSSYQFLPIFIKEHNVLSEKDQRDIYSLFKLFQQIRKNSIIVHPIQINLENSNLLLLSCSVLNWAPRLLVQNIVSKTITEDELADLVQDYHGELIESIFSIRYPYNTSIDPRLELHISGRKSFDLTFKNRFSYDEITDKSIFLLQRELTRENDEVLSLPEEFKIYDTNHPQDLYFKLKELRKEWGGMQYNPYKTPFPSKWFFCVHQGRDLIFWKEKFKIDYPLVKQSILERCLKLIEDLYQLNWIKSYIEKTYFTHFFLPKSRLHSEVIISFRDYILELNTNAELVEVLDIEILENYDVTIFDSFNLIELCNWYQKFEARLLKVIVPDFISHHFQPFMKYFIAKYQYSALIEGLRTSLDPNIKQTDWQKKIMLVLAEVRTNRSNYVKRYDSSKIEEDSEIEISIDTNELDYTEAEFLELSNSRNIPKIDGTLVIDTYCNQKIQLRNTQSILIWDQGFIKRVNADSLKSYDKFVPSNEFNLLIDKEFLSEKLIKIPENAKTWQVQLWKANQNVPDLYDLMVKRGLQLQTSSRFFSHYMVEEYNSDLPTNLPLRNINWKVVCEYLGIDHADMVQAKIAYYGRANLNNLKNLYQQIISEMILNNWFGEFENPEVINSIATIIRDSNFFDSTETGMEFSEIAKLMIKSITQNIDFLQVKNINSVQ